MSVRPRRSVLYVPGSNARAIEKAQTLPVDTVILDLEDSVAPEGKAEARARVVEAVATGFGVREVVVRINGLDTEWWLEDVDAVARARPDGILLPKVTGPDQLEDLAERLVDIGADHKIRVWAMMETALAMLNAREIAAVAKDVETRLSVLVMGTNDLAKETRTKLVAGRAAILPWLMNCITAARAYRLDIVDGVFSNINDAEGFAHECAQSSAMGFDGRTVIHPNQIDACNAAFTPSEQEIVQAKYIMSAFDRPENKGKGVILLDGRMVERLHADIARQTVAVAAAIAARGM